MSHARRNARRTSKKGPSAFAPTSARDGRSLTWESIALQPTPVSLTTAFPVLGPVANVVARTMIPANITRGVVTLERIRGEIRVWHDKSIVEGNTLAWPVSMQIQLVPVRNAVIESQSMLSPTNQADLESNRIIWRRDYLPGDVALSVGGSVSAAQEFPPPELDVKSRRKFDRSLWALALVVSADAAALLNHLITFDVRALFRAPDGL